MGRGDAPADVQWARAFAAVAIAFVLRPFLAADASLNFFFGVH